MILLVQSILRVKPLGLVGAGIPCSPHVWVSSGTTGKSKKNPRGNGGFLATAGNMQVARVAACLLIACVRKVFWYVEQPGSSVMAYLEEILHLLGAPAELGLAAARQVRLLLVCIHIITCYVPELIACNSRRNMCSQPSWMGLFGAPALKRTQIFGNA